MPTRPIFDTTAVAVILKKVQNNIGLPMPWDNLCYCLLEAAWRTVADLVRYLCLLKSVVSTNQLKKKRTRIIERTRKNAGRKKDLDAILCCAKIQTTQKHSIECLISWSNSSTI